MMLHTGSCHCGAIRVEFESDKPLAPRACQCSFCRKHGARSVSDAEGAATIACSVEPLAYRFASRAADYLICRVCGVYLGAVTGGPEARLATLNLNAFDDPHLNLGAEPVSYEGESADRKAERRRQRWTPVSIRPAE